MQIRTMTNGFCSERFIIISYEIRVEDMSNNTHKKRFYRV